MIVAAFIVIGLLVAAGVVRWMLHRAALSARAKPGTAPTPAQAKIDSQRAEQLAQSAATAADEEKKVLNASNDDLDTFARDELLGRDPAAPGKPPG